MARILTILTFLFISNISFGQTDIGQEILDKIEPGYSTRWDIEQLYGKGELIDNHFLNPDNERDQGKTEWVHSNGIQYKEQGITFVCADDGEKISSIYLTSPFKLTLNRQNIIYLGQTSLGNAFPRIDTIKVNTTGASYYWSFSIDRYRFYVAKPIDHRNKGHYSEVPSFKDNLEYYKTQPINIIEIGLYDYNRFETESIKKEENLLCARPIYAHKEENHLNCYEMGWPKKLTWIEIPFYALTGGGKSEKIKQRYWKEYSSAHKLVYEGAFKDNKEIGLFKYYDQEGNLVRTENFSELKFNWTYLIIVGFSIIVLTILIKKRRMKNAT